MSQRAVRWLAASPCAGGADYQLSSDGQAALASLLPGRAEPGCPRRSWAGACHRCRRRAGTGAPRGRPAGEIGGVQSRSCRRWRCASARKDRSWGRCRLPRADSCSAPVCARTGGKSRADRSRAQRASESPLQLDGARTAISLFGATQHGTRQAATGAIQGHHPPRQARAPSASGVSSCAAGCRRSRRARWHLPIARAPSAHRPSDRAGAGCVPPLHTGADSGAAPSPDRPPAPAGPAPGQRGIALLQRQGRGA